MSKCTVFYESWQMDCCGEEFSIGDTVKWIVDITDCLNTAIDIGKIDYCYEAHSSELEKLFVLEGKVEKIDVLYERYEPSKDNSKLLVAVDGKIVETTYAGAFPEGLDNMVASGYIVMLSDYTIRPAEKSDITFE